jgi:uncharacterized protein
MTVELTPFGVACNIGCVYCYQDPMRDAGNVLNGRYDLAKMKAGLDAEGRDFTMFGGEPLLMPIADLEEMWRWGLERFGPTKPAGQNVNAVQTNGTLITPAHVALFRKYRVGVGVSIDGPGELNDARWSRSAEETREMTARTEAAIRALCADGQAPSVIATLHRLNAAPERLPRLKAWFRELDALGVRHARLHVLEVDHPALRQRLVLDDDETEAAFVEMAALEAELPALRFDVFRDVEALLAGDDRNVTCTWHACDPYTTDAVRGVDGQGERTNCGRTNKDGVAWRKAPRAGHERQLALFHTPQEHGGCQGCRFFFACKGQCPGTALDGDWRNRSEGCPLWMALFGAVEARMLAAGRTPLSVDPRRPEVERRLLAMWAAGQQGSIARALAGDGPRRADPGDHGDDHQDWHGDSPHGDSPHGDSEVHGDHTDDAMLRADGGSRERPLGVAQVVERGKPCGCSEAKP